MLTVQPAISSQKTAFGNRRDQRCLSQDEAQALREQREYERNYDELLDQKEEFLDLANNSEFKVPKPAKKILEGGAVITTGLLGGMATGWGAKKSIQGFAKLNKTAAVVNLKKHAAATNEFLKTSAKAIKKEFIKSDAYNMPANAIKKQYKKFANTKIGKPIAKFFEAVGNGISKIFKGLKSGIKYLSDKVKGIDKNKVEKVTVNTAGISGGIASGVTAIKEKQEAVEE